MTQRYGESEGSLDIDFLFDFEQWIHQHDLAKIKQVFIDFAMCVPQSLHFQNPQFSKLLADHRIVTNPDLIPRIISAVQSLQEAQKGTVLLVSNAENDALNQIKHLIENMHALRDSFASISEQYRAKKSRDQQQIVNYIHCSSDCLSQKHKNITESFTVLFNMLEAKELAMRTKIEEYTKRFNRFHVEHRKTTNVLDSKLKETELTIQHDLNHMKEQEMYCTEIIRDYNNHLSARKVQTDRSRESKILKICKHTRGCYDEALQFIRKNREEITSFVDSKIEFDVDLKRLQQRKQLIYWADLDKAAFDTIQAHIPRFVDIFCVDEEGYGKAMARQSAPALPAEPVPVEQKDASVSVSPSPVLQPGSSEKIQAAIASAKLAQRKKLRMTHFVTKSHIRSQFPKTAPVVVPEKVPCHNMAVETVTDNRIDVPSEPVIEYVDKSTATDPVMLMRVDDVVNELIEGEKGCGPVDGDRNGEDKEVQTVSTGLVVMVDIDRFGPDCIDHALDWIHDQYCAVSVRISSKSGFRGLGRAADGLSSLRLCLNSWNETWRCLSAVRIGKRCPR